VLLSAMHVSLGKSKKNHNVTVQTWWHVHRHLHWYLRLPRISAMTTRLKDGGLLSVQSLPRRDQPLERC